MSFIYDLFVSSIKQSAEIVTKNIQIILQISYDKCISWPPQQMTTLFDFGCDANSSNEGLLDSWEVVESGPHHESSAIPFSNLPPCHLIVSILKYELHTA